MVSTSFIRITKTAIVLVYFVIIAGATVRMTGSGMGCPDWPKCFGYYVPPTDVSQLTWHPGHAYRKGQVIILDEKLWVARTDFVSGPQYDPAPWEVYTRHDYAIFNPYHTWIEYVNRLFGALSGLACLAVFAASFVYWKRRKSVVIWSGVSLFLLLFNAWLGATVVFSVLSPVKITTHMIAALLTVASLLYVLFLAGGDSRPDPAGRRYVFFLWVALALTLVQVILGTQVRQAIDSLTRAGISDPVRWLESPDAWFYVHRSLSIMVLAVNLYLWTQRSASAELHRRMNVVMAILLFEVGSGIAMAYFGFPFGSQALHLVLASLLFGVQFDAVLRSGSSRLSRATDR